MECIWHAKRAAIGPLARNPGRESRRAESSSLVQAWFSLYNLSRRSALTTASAIAGFGFYWTIAAGRAPEAGANIRMPFELHGVPLALVLASWVGLAVTSRCFWKPHRAGTAVLLAEAATGGALLHQHVTDLLETARGSAKRVAVIHIHVDRLATTLHLLGSTARSGLVLDIYRRVRAKVFRADFIARVKSDEFTVALIGNLTRDDLTRIAAHVVGTLSEPYEVAGRRVELAVFAGVSVSDGSTTTTETLLKKADIAMYRARAARLARPCFFDPAVDSHLMDRQTLEQDLRRAADRGELFLLYQPQVSAHTGKLTGFEALVRWRHPQRGLIMPNDFIGMAEETGSIDGIGRFVVEQACEDAAAWPDELRVAVNVSSVQFRSPDLLATILAAVDRSGLAPERLEIEVTESALMEDAGRAVDVLSQLHNHGIQVALDDFGIGYSSLSYLRLFKFDKLKIDRSFVSDLECSSEVTKIIRTIVRLGKDLGLTITVEGVENEVQRAILHDEGVDQIQGYLIGKPGRVEAFPAFVQLLKRTQTEAALA